MHEGNAPEFIISKTREEFGRYPEIIESEDNPVEKLIIISTKKAKEFLLEFVTNIFEANKNFQIILIK